MPTQPVVNVRANLGRLMKATLADQALHHDWTYHAVRPTPMPPRTWEPGMKVVGDCSKGVQFLGWWTPGAPDPMGNHWGVNGNSQTICIHLQDVVRASELLIGDIVTFGRDGADHAAMVLERGDDPLLWSFGHQGAPNSYRLSADSREHQLLRLPVAVYIPTPDDLLRQKIGWFSWVAWKLGEGDWAHHKPAAPTVRPNVPRVIPATWWARYAQFLRNRDKGDAPTTSA